MERKITTHNDTSLTIRAHGEPNAAGAQNRYLITVDPRTVPLGTSAALCDIRFQNGDPTANGVNGVTMEALIAVAADRLTGLQEGAYPCDENAAALVYLHCAIQALHNRTRRLAAERAAAAA